jgi:hypothetical protein
MTKRKKVFITSLIVLLLIIAGGFYYLFFTGQLGILADLVTGPNERVVASKNAQEIYESAEVKENLILEDNKIVIQDGAKQGVLVDTIEFDELEQVRRLLWDAEVNDKAYFSMMIQTSADGEKWSDWSARSREGWYYHEIDKPVSKVRYLANFSREPLMFPADFEEEELINTQQEEAVDTQQADTVSKQKEQRLHLHLYQGGQDRGRYLGSLMDNSGMKQDIYYLTMLTDKMSFVSEQHKGKSRGREYQNPLYDFVKSNNIKLYFVDENENNPEEKIVGEALAASRKKFDQSKWKAEHGYLGSIIDISGKHSDRMFPVTMSTSESKGVSAGERETTSDFNISKSEKNWLKLSDKNTKRYEDLSSVRKMQKTTRVMFKSLKDDVVAEDNLAKLSVNGSDKGYYIGSGVNLSGGHSDVLFPIWLTNKSAWVGAGELDLHLFQKEIGTKFGMFPLIPQSSEENSRDFARTESVSILRGSSNAEWSQDLAIYVDVTTKDDPQQPEVCDNFDKLEINPESVNLSPNENFQFNFRALSKDETEIDLDQLDYSFTVTGGAIDGSGNYQAPEEEGTFEVSITSLCDGYAKADIVVEGDPSEQIVESPQLIQVGLTTGYSPEEPDQPEVVDQPEEQTGSPSEIPGWVKGSLIKTGTDLIVLIVVSILVVIGLMYLVSLLKDREDLSEVKERKK